MKYATITEYVTKRNQLNELFGVRSRLNLGSSADRKTIAAMLDADLSPENLTCDGELSVAQVRTRKLFIEKALAELKVLDTAGA